MTRTTPEMAPLSELSILHQAHIHVGSSVETAFEPAPARSRDLTTRSPQSYRSTVKEKILTELSPQWQITYRESSKGKCIIAIYLYVTFFPD
ncbi:hypothetical protein AVEN_131081-1 [Araneus ventricosus]|uniref:Uncharacterized protein n=1 Tax=Araneus ventricosus TaxID=182803 RepID=A0A4Y2D2J4_ARAVE|nr:hypothetical protein AVEN_131081-1 [Araneus ventricosus]